MRLLREPLLHFLLAGAALFAAGLCYADNSAVLGGPSSVHGQLHKDQQAAPGATIPLKDHLKDDSGLELGVDDNYMAQWASSSLAEKDAQGGIARLYGSWPPFRRGRSDAGKLVCKGENRHLIGGGITTIDLAPTAGYAGITNLN